MLGLGGQPTFSREPVHSPELGHGPSQTWGPGYTAQYLLSLTWQCQQASFAPGDDGSAKLCALQSLHGHRGPLRWPVPLPSLPTPAGGPSQHKHRSPEPGWLTPSLQDHLPLFSQMTSLLTTVSLIGGAGGHQDLTFTLYPRCPSGLWVKTILRWSCWAQGNA